MSQPTTFDQMNLISGETSAVQEFIDKDIEVPVDTKTIISYLKQSITTDDLPEDSPFTKRVKQVRQTII